MKLRVDELTPFASYTGVGTVVPLSAPYTNYKWLGFRFGSNTDHTDGGGVVLRWCPVIPNGGLQNIGNQIECTYTLNGVLVNGTIEFASATSMKITGAKSQTEGAAFTLRQVYGVK